MAAHAGPSPHLSWAELACHDGTPYPSSWRVERARPLAEVFETLRATWALPLLVLSAYRTPSWNRHIGGARASQHLQGRALDVTPVRGVTVEELWRVTVSLAHARATALRGVGRYDRFIHLDTRPSDRLVLWDARVDPLL